MGQLFEMSDSDSDYVDIGEDDGTLVDDVNDDVEPALESSGKGRGKDIDWLEVARYMDKSAYENSAFYLDIRKNFTLRRCRETDFSDNEHFTFKYSRKRGFLVCPIQYKVHFLTTSNEIVVMSNTRCHVHQEDTNYTTDGPNLHWTNEQTEIVMDALKHDGSAKTVTRQLKDANIFSEGNFPSASQINAKIAYCRSILRKTIEIFDTFQLREKIAEKLEVPSEDTESYIAYHHIDDEDDSKDPHFCIIWTSKKLLARISDDFTQDDATYRLTWQGYPFFVSGRSHPSGKFFATHVTLASHEDTRAWVSSYLFVKEKATPR
jgi:hypothetical protein